jgi:hypothetical protein
MGEAEARLQWDSEEGARPNAETGAQIGTQEMLTDPSGVGSASRVAPIAPLRIPDGAAVQVIAGGPAAVRAGYAFSTAS